MRPNFIAGSEAPLRLTVRGSAQQQAMPVVGVLDSGSKLGLVASLAHGHHFFIEELAERGPNSCAS